MLKWLGWWFLVRAFSLSSFTSVSVRRTSEHPFAAATNTCSQQQRTPTTPKKKMTTPKKKLSPRRPRMTFLQISKTNHAPIRVQRKSKRQRDKELKSRRDKETKRQRVEESKRKRVGAESVLSVHSVKFVVSKGSAQSSFHSNNSCNSCSKSKLMAL